MLHFTAKPIVCLLTTHFYYWFWGLSDLLFHSHCCFCSVSVYYKYVNLIAGLLLSYIKSSSLVYITFSFSYFTSLLTYYCIVTDSFLLSSPIIALSLISPESLVLLMIYYSIVVDGSLVPADTIALPLMVPESLHLF